MPRICFIVFVVFLSVFANAWADTSSSGRITMTFDLSNHGLEKTAQLWIPYPVTNAHQRVSDISVKGSWSSSGVYTDAVFGTPMLYARWDKGVKARQLTFSFNVSRKEVVRRDFPVKEADWDPADYALFLAPTRLGPVDGEVKVLADAITLGQDTVLGKAKAIYDWTCKNTFRNPDTRGCGIGDVYKLLKEPGGKCADISSIYVALARAAGVPSREVFGIRQGREEVQDISTWQHCWAEFYLPGYGWVPVDPADVRKMMLRQCLAITDEKTAAARGYFWGGIDPFRLKLAEGRDVVLNPSHSGEPVIVNYLMYPHAMIGEKTVDWLDPETFAYNIEFRL